LCLGKTISIRRKTSERGKELTDPSGKRRPKEAEKWDYSGRKKNGGEGESGRVPSTPGVKEEEEGIEAWRKGAECTNPARAKKGGEESVDTKGKRNGPDLLLTRSKERLKSPRVLGGRNRGG